jgi:hypothetical protein
VQNDKLGDFAIVTQSDSWWFAVQINYFLFVSDKEDKLFEEHGSNLKIRKGRVTRKLSVAY